MMVLMTNKKLDFSTAPKFIQQFENDNINELAKLKYGKWHLWQIIKVPLFYYLLRDNNQQQVLAKSNKFTVFKKIISLYNGFLNLFKISFCISKPHSILCVTHYVDCLSKKDGKHYNSLFDYIISNSTKTSISHWEYYSSTKSPRYNSPKIKIENAEGLFYRLNKTSAISPKSINDFLEIWNHYIQKNKIVTNNLDKVFIDKLCLSFQKSYSFWQFCLKRKKPSKIFSSEKMCTGMLAAANDLNIPFYEFQHGNIDKHYPPYVWNKRWNELGTLIKPNYLVLFGNTAKKTVEAEGFFNANEIITIGYEKMEQYRSEKKEDNGYIFFALQPMMNELNKLIINEIIQLSSSYKIAIKYHPLQLQQEVNEYNELLKDNNVKIIEQDKNIYDCILESKVVVSHVSTVLEEALSLGKVAITITTKNLPEGIHTLTGNTYLASAITPVAVDDLHNFLQQFFSENIVYKNLIESIDKYKFEIYEANYYNNILKLLKIEYA
jgi:hypothetical protein